MGGIATSSTSHRPWYASRLHTLSTKLRIYDWELIKKILSSFLWWDYICDEPAKKLWHESDHQRTRYRVTTALESYGRNEESGISSTNLVTTEVSVTDIEDKPCQLVLQTMNVDTPDSAIVRISWRDYSICSI